MGRLTNLLLLLSTCVGIVSTIIFITLVEPHPVPKVEDEYWGPASEQAKVESTAIRPFKIDISSDIINDLRTTLKRELSTSKSRLAAPLEGVGFEYGFNTNYLQVVGNHWLNEYNWTERQAGLNKYPHFKTKIGGLDIHFQHVKPNESKRETRAILILHGWPGSFVEFQKLIPLLAESDKSKYGYELVIPSLPGYAFSSAAARPGMSCSEMANIFKRLMTRLGHKKFYVMGGDWGSEIATDLAVLYPENVIAAQSNLCHTTTVISFAKYLLAVSFPSIFRTERDYEQPKILSVPELLHFTILESGYFHIQATKPDTIGVGLTYSPLGLAAYILEKFSAATNRSWITREDGGLLEKFTMDELLDNIMIYWVTGSALSAGRIYKEQMNPEKKHKLDRVPTDVPFSCQYLPEEILVMPEYALENKYHNIESYTVESKGGHFGAMEEPELIAQNVISHFDKH